MMSPKKQHPIIELVDGLAMGESVIIRKQDYTGYMPLAGLLCSYYRYKPVRKKFKVTRATTHPPCWEIKRVE